MKELSKGSTTQNLIPIIADVERNIDGYKMLRCSYFAVQSDEPLPDWNLRAGEFSSPILLLNLEAILLGAPNETRTFASKEDVTAMYDYIEKQDEMFVDINDIWVPVEWFGGLKIKQGMVFRIPQDLFILAWKFRNDKIYAKELFGHKQVRKAKKLGKTTKSAMISFSDKESRAFTGWTNLQIEESKKKYEKHRAKMLKRIKS